MVDYSIKDYPNGRIKIVPIHEIIITKHKSWPIRTYNTVKKLFMDQMERLLNSAEELNLEEVIFEVTVIPNRKGKASNKLLKDFTDSQLKHINEGRPLQKRVAEDLHEQSGVEIKEEGNNLDDLKAFENYLNIRIIVFTSNSTEYIVYNGNEEYNEQIYLYYHDEHFDTITNITGFLAKRRFCKVCLIGYTEQHTCKDNTVTTIRKQHICDKCNKTYTGKNHKCGEKICLICYEKYTESNEEHLCYMKPSVPKQVKNNKYIYFDFEANQETGIHIMNFCIAYDLENIYCFKNNYVKVFKCDFNIDDLNLLELDIDDCFSDVEKIPFREYETPIGNSVIDNFCKYFIRDKFKDYTFISHYGKGYDMQPILGWIIKNKIEHSIISSGLKLTFIVIKGINLRFIDSINFTLCGLAAFPKTFGFVGNKGYFPHYFNTTENQKYKGIYPDKEYFGYNTMTIKNKELFDEWYNKVKEKEFKFNKEIFYYCLLDVLILAKGCTLYRKLFLNITNNCIDPFQYITIAQCCTKIFKTLMLTNETIGIHKKMTIKEVHSQKSIQWLEYISLEYNIMIQHAKRGGEKKLFINNKCYKVDGYYYDRENKMRNVYEFFGCYWHGCPKCYSPEEICKKDRNKKTMKELYNETKERLKIIKDNLKPNVKIHTIWECEFDQQKYPEVDPHLKPIDKRDAFYGGRTETIQLYNNLSDLKDTFMKYKQEASGCKCDPKYCKNDCKNDKECKTKIQYIIDNTAYDLDIDKVKYNSGLRFIAKICLNNLWGHFGMRDNFTQKEYCFTLEHITKIVFNEKYKDISTMILDEDIVLTEYKNKEEYSKPNPSVNVYIALFTTAHARLKLYELLGYSTRKSFIHGYRFLYL
ncbi:unnamed protein product [Mytilus edulis]|uniref:DNA-directed DNA polymerase n=1 Tax=Mytilus edulis TaxID=6550 RepID=A0A8S3RDG3_MYTED|nr:unnamed protein product [Mytilus edulis]